MYIPTANHVTDLQELHAFVLANSFAMLVSRHNDEPWATHLPLQVIDAGGQWRVEGHFAKANPHWNGIEGQRVLAVFAGPHAYVSPTNYAQNTGVPTWNYAAVHLYGTVTLHHDPARKLEILSRLQGHYEHTTKLTFAEQTDAFREGQLKGIVAFDMAVDRIEGKYKLSQNRSPEDQQAVATWLEGSRGSAARGTAAMMRKDMQRRNMANPVN